MTMTIAQLKEANQITRYCLIGSGIVHGLEVYVDENSYIHISAGAALTSDGTYVESAPKKCFTFYHASSATDGWSTYFNQKLQAAHPNLQNPQFQTWKLLEQYPTNLSEDYKVHSLKPQNSSQLLNPFLSDKVILLYTVELTELPTTEEAINDPINAPKTKQEHTFLLATQEDVLKLLQLNRLATNILWTRLRDDDDYISSDVFFPERPNLKDLNRTYNPALQLEEIPLLRFGFAPGNPFVCPPTGEDLSVFPEIASLDNIYTGNSAQGTSGYADAIDAAISPLDKALRKLVNLFLPIWTKQRGWDFEQTIDLLKDKWEAHKRMNQDATKAKKEYAQYFYDWMRDLLQAYHELRILLIDLVADTFPKKEEHPQHLLLGITQKEKAVQIPNPLRHHFVQPPIYNNNAARLEQVNLYFWRILTMIKGFYLPDYLPTTMFRRCNIGMDDGKIDLSYDIIKITPSKFYNHPLAEQSIPFYYTVIYDNSNSVHGYWNYRRTKASTEDHLLSYHANDSQDDYTEVPQAVHPLHYNLDGFDFYRIEGHIGRLIDFYEEKKDAEIKYFVNIDGGKVEFTSDESALKKYFDYLIQKYNLDFEVKFIKIKPASEAEAAIKATQESSKTTSFQDKSTKTVTENHWSRTQHLLGMEHLAGVKKGGTFVVIHEDGKAIADFSLPYRLSYCKQSQDSLDNDAVVNKIKQELLMESKALTMDILNLSDKLDKQKEDQSKEMDILKDQIGKFKTQATTSSFPHQDWTDELEKIELKLIESQKIPEIIEQRLSGFDAKLKALDGSNGVFKTQIGLIEARIDIISNRNTGIVNPTNTVLNKIGTDSLKNANIKANFPVLDDYTVAKLQSVGIFTTKQLSKLEDNDLIVLDQITGAIVSTLLRDQDILTKAKNIGTKNNK